MTVVTCRICHMSIWIR